MTPALNTLAVGDHVTVSPTDGDVETDDARTMLITDRREIPAIPGPVGGGREAMTLLRLPNGCWYDCATGIGYTDRTTRISPSNQ